MNNEIVFKVAGTEADFAQGRELFREYAKSLPVDLAFQDFETELINISRQYCKPSGALLLVIKADALIGCAGIRKIDDVTAELKRMYIRPPYRGQQVGLKLLEHALVLARFLGYKKIRLDTLKHMTEAQALYTASGFYEIPAYRFNPFEGAIYMEKEL